MKKTKKPTPYKLALQHYIAIWWENRKTSIPTLIAVGIGTILIAYVPALIIAKLIGDYSGKPLPSPTELTPYIAAYGGVWLLGEIFWRIGIHFDIIHTANGIRRLSNDAFTYLLEKDLSFFHDNFAGSLTKKTIAYHFRYIEVTGILLYDIAPSIIPLIFVVVVLSFYSWWLVFALIAMLIITIACVIPLLKRRQKLVIVREKAANKVSGHIADVYANIDAVRAFARDDYEIKNHSKDIENMVGKFVKSWHYQNRRIDIFISPMYVATNVIGLIIALYIAQYSNTPLPAIVIAFTYYAHATRSMWAFNGIYRRFEAAMSDAAQFTELLDQQPTITDTPSAKQLDVKSGGIEFKNVVFSHDSQNTVKLFNNFNLSVKPGEKVGIVGRSGGGKTTLTKLLLRFMDIDGGSISIDGQNIAEVRQADLRSHIAYVPQEPFMFHRSIADNIAYGKLDATQQDIENVAKSSHSIEFIQGMEKQYETIIGERGVKLSGGQRQRIAIARAMIKEAPILVLDEATSALDSESETLIQDALWSLMQNKTAIVIAHRLSTIQKMDRIIVIDNGKIIEEGSHNDLLSKKGVYAELWAHQSGGFLED